MPSLRLIIRHVNVSPVHVLFFIKSFGSAEELCTLS